MSRRRAALLVVLAGAGLLTGCTAAASPVPPEQTVARALDNFAADNTGRYTLTVDLGDSSMTEEGTYRVSPDAGATMRTFQDPAGETVVRYLRVGPAVWFELPGDGGARSGCWLHGTSGAVQSVDGVDTGAVQLATPAVEVVLGLEHGRRDGDRFVADASLKTVAAALGYGPARELGISSERVDVPVTLTIKDSRITSWSVELADLGADEGPGTITASFTDAGADLDLTPPDEDATVEAPADGGAVDGCMMRP